MKKLFTFFELMSSVAFFNAQIVINEIYTGGGLLGAVLANDFIELKNIGNTNASLDGMTMQYGSANGQFTQYHTLPNVTLPPGQTFLIQQASEGLGGINLINPNLIVDVVLNLDGSGPVLGLGVQLGLTSGKVALASNNTRVTGPTASNVVDFVGYGLADQYEGGGAAPSPTILNSITRISGDTNHNGVDFTAAIPTPQAGVNLAVSELSAGKNSLVVNTLVMRNEIYFRNPVSDIQIFSMSGQLVKTAAVKADSKISVNLPKGQYIVTGTVDGKKMSNKIVVQ